MQKVSIIIPVYNGADYIGNLLKKLIALPHNMFEIIVVNDGSVDKTGSICKALSSVYSHLKYIYQENQGVSKARNTGIANAKGEYLAFCDADDDIDIENFQVFINEVLANQAEYYMTGYTEHNCKKNTLRIVEAQGGGMYSIYDFGKLFFGNLKLNLISYPVNKVFLKSIIENNNLRFDENISFAEDLHFNLDYLKYVQKIWISNINSYIYNKYFNQNSLSSNFTMEFWKARKIVYDKLDIILNVFGNSDQLKVLQNTYAANVLIYTTRQVVNQKTSISYKISNLNDVIKDDFIYKFIHSELNLTKNQKLLLNIIKKKRIYLIYIFWALFEYKNRMNNRKEK